MSKMTGDFPQRIEKNLMTGVLAMIKAEMTEEKTVSHRDILGMTVRTKKYERRDSSDNVKKQYPRRSSSNKKYETRDRSVSKKREQSPRNTNCLRCGGAHLSSSCKKYDFYNGAPCTKCEFLHATADQRGKRQNSIEKKPKKEYSIPDHRYRDPYDGIFSTSVIKSDGTPENIFRDTKN
jgi:hypothetical protein